MSRPLSVLLIALALAGCQNKPTVQSAPVMEDGALPLYQHGYAPSRHNIKLSSYVEQLVISLQQNSTQKINGNISVSSFVNFDSSLQNTNAVGNQLAENFTTQLRRFGFAVSDSKLTKAISITPQGDFVFTRQVRKLRRNSDLCCVLAGTMIYAPQGIEVNARIMDLATQAVLSSASTTIPYFVVEHLGMPQ
jgi:TolB-like protein